MVDPMFRITMCTYSFILALAMTLIPLGASASGFLNLIKHHKCVNMISYRGKTTLNNALFRLVEPADGKIIIDNINVCSIGLHNLRSRLGIIPQDPTLFGGSVRYDLDPLEQHSDNEKLALNSVAVNELSHFSFTMQLINN
ncbi:ABC transporter C family member 10-like protein [Corchorus olitorius]|uniref:ABC transporter C family member 10-like protein n=1 Tax=Corchorus olitorius TaxID=93759 RepID=A0A1R3G8V5_9ROSI|nr:ABC transporter C family member 10-like protein [Corchorus olitorius]